MLVSRSRDLTCLEDLTIVAILSTSKLPAWDEEFFCMNNLVFGTWAQVGPKAGLVENVDFEESVTTLLVICRIQTKMRQIRHPEQTWQLVKPWQGASFFPWKAITSLRYNKVYLPQLPLNAQLPKTSKFLKGSPSKNDLRLTIRSNNDIYNNPITRRFATNVTGLMK